MKVLKKSLIFLLSIFILFNVNVFATEVDISNSIKKLATDEITKVLLDENLLNKLNEILPQLEISQITKLEGTKEEVTSETPNEEGETKKEILYSYNIETDKIPIIVYVKNSKIEKITTNIKLEENETLEAVIYNGKEILEYKIYYKFLESQNTITELTEENESNAKVKGLFYLFGGLSLVFLLTTIVCLIKANSNHEKYFMESCEKEKYIEELEVSIKNTEILNKKLQKANTEISSKKEELDNKELYIDKLSRCIAKLDKELQEEKAVSATTLKNFETMHQQDLKSIGAAHQDEIARLNKETDSRISNIRKDYENKIKELEDNNRGLQKALTNITNNK